MANHLSREQKEIDMRRFRRLASLLCLLLPVALWALSGWSQLPAGKIVQPSPSGPTMPPDPVIQAIIDQVTEAEFVDIDGGLSGAHAVTVGGNPVTFTTRYSPSAQGALAEQYVFEYFTYLGLATSYHTYTSCGFTARNVV